MKDQPLVIATKIKLKRFDSAYCGGLDKADTKQRTDVHDRRIGRVKPMGSS